MARSMSDRQKRRVRDALGLGSFRDVVRAAKADGMSTEQKYASYLPAYQASAAGRRDAVRVKRSAAAKAAWQRRKYGPPLLVNISYTCDIRVAQAGANPHWRAHQRRDLNVELHRGQIDMDRILREIAGVVDTNRDPYYEDRGYVVEGIRNVGNVAWTETDIHGNVVPMANIRARAEKPLLIDGDDDDGSANTGRGMCSADLLWDFIEADKQKDRNNRRLNCHRVYKTRGDVELALQGYHPQTDERISGPNGEPQAPPTDYDPMEPESETNVKPEGFDADDGLGGAPEYATWDWGEWPPLAEGVVAAQLVAACRLGKFNVYIVDEDTKCFAEHREHAKASSGTPAMLVRVQNGHIYPINTLATKLRVANAVSRGAKYDDEPALPYHDQAPDDKPKAVDVGPKMRAGSRKGAKGIKLGEQADKKAPHKPVIIVPHESFNPVDVLAAEIARTGKIPRHTAYYDGALQSFRIGNEKHTINTDHAQAEAVFRKLRVPFTGQTLATAVGVIAKQPDVELDMDALRSHLNPHVFDTLTAPGVRGRVHRGIPLALDIAKIQEALGASVSEWRKAGMVSFDQKKAYAACLYDPAEPWMRFDFADEWSDFNPANGDSIDTLGFYFVHTKDRTLLKGSNVYSSAILQVAREHRIRFTVKSKLLPSNSLPVETFRRLLDKIAAVTDGDNDALKSLLVKVSGLLGRTERQETSVKINSDYEQARSWFTRNGLLEATGRYMKHLDVPGYGKHYMYGYNVKTTLAENTLPIYLQILDNANIRLFRMAKAMGGQVIYRNVDMVVTRRSPLAGGEPIVQPDDLVFRRHGWGGYVDELPKGVYLERPSEPVALVGHPTWTDHPHLHDSDQHEKIGELIRYKRRTGHRGTMITGRAGTGKTFVIKNVVGDLDGTYVRLAPTNKAAIVVRGQTIHTFMRFTAEGKINPKALEFIRRQAIDYIVIDEISMIGLSMWASLVHLQRVTGAFFILVGDHRQCPPVEGCHGPHDDYFNHSAVMHLAGCNRLELTVRQRYDKEMWDAGEDVNNCRTRFADRFGRRGAECRRSVCFTNETRLRVNHAWMTKEAAAAKAEGATVLDVAVDPWNDKCQPMAVFEGMPVVGIKGLHATKDVVRKDGETLTVADKDADHQVANNETFVVRTVDVAAKTVTIVTTRADAQDTETEHVVELGVAKFAAYCVPGYCTTVHAAQGETIDGDYAIYEWNRMPTKIRYTALTRGRTLGQVHFVDNLSGLPVLEGIHLGSFIAQRIRQHKAEDIRKNRHFEHADYITVEYVMALLKALVASGGMCSGKLCGNAAISVPGRFGDDERWSIDRIAWRGNEPHVKGNVRIRCKKCNDGRSE